MLQAIAMTQMGLALEDFWKLTPFEFKTTYETWLRDQEHRERAMWERARWTVFATHCPPQKKQVRMTDFIQFPWDGEIIAATQSTADRFNELKDRWR